MSVRFAPLYLVFFFSNAATPETYTTDRTLPYTPLFRSGRRHGDGHSGAGRRQDALPLSRGRADAGSRLRRERSVPGREPRTRARQADHDLPAGAGRDEIGRAHV